MDTTRMTRAELVAELHRLELENTRLREQAQQSLADSWELNNRREEAYHTYGANTW